MHQECELSIITVNYNGIKDTCALIDSIPFNDQMEVIVVDNASKVDEASIIAQRYPQVEIIRSNNNLGFAGGNNLGIKVAKGKYIFLINNDTIFKEFNILPLIKRLEMSPTIGMVCPKILFAWGNNLIQFAGYTPLSKITVRNQAIGYGKEDKGQYDIPHPTPYAHGAAMLIKREVIEKVGLMPECYFLYYEELDWSMMFLRAGYKIWYEPACTIYHKESQSTRQGSPLRSYFMTRNRLLLVKRNWESFHKFFTYIYIIGLVIPRDIIKNIISGNMKHVKAIFAGFFDFFHYFIFQCSR